MTRKTLQKFFLLWVLGHFKFDLGSALPPFHRGVKREPELGLGSLAQLHWPPFREEQENLRTLACRLTHGCCKALDHICWLVSQINGPSQGPGLNSPTNTRLDRTCTVSITFQKRKIVT